jgi:orotate phosphoribosyltransferase
MGTAGARDRLRELLRERSFAKKRVVLASGKESDFFIDCKQTVLTAEGHALVGELMLDALAELPPCDAIAGVELGGCPLASAASLTSFLRDAPKDAVYVRKDAKEHGSKRQLEGDTRLATGASLVILEDGCVVTTA